nr:hypothetical protein [Tanacetum cinerariifolium]
SWGNFYHQTACLTFLWMSRSRIPAYDFFAPRPVTGYAGNPNNNNGWIEADVSLLRELGAVDIAMLFGDDDFRDDDFEGFKDEEEVWKVNKEWLMAPVTPPPMLVVSPPSTYEVRGNLEYEHGQLVKKVIQVSDAKVADGGAGSVDCDSKRRGDYRLSQQVHALQATVQLRDSQIQQL